MTDQPTTFWQRQQEKPVRLFGAMAIVSLVLIVGANIFVEKAPRGPDWSDVVVTTLFVVLFCVFILSLIGLVLSLIRWTRPVVIWVMKRWAFCLAALITLTALFYAEENWRGRRAWDKCKQELEAQGHVLDWQKFIPPPVPDDQNFFKAPHMAEWFVKSYRGSTTNSFTARLANPKTASISSTTNAIGTAAEAKDYLAWSDQFASDFSAIREALKRPGFRMDYDYTMPYEIPIPNYVSVREVCRTLAQRAHCYLLLDQPDKAAQELMFLRDICQMLEKGKPMTLVGAMINAAVTSLYAETINEGFRLHAWKEPQLEMLQQQLQRADLISPVVDAMETGPAMTCGGIEILNGKLFNYLRSQRRPRPWLENRIVSLWPRGWTYQNMANAASLEFSLLKGVNVSMQTVSPGELEKQTAAVVASLDERMPHPYKAMAAIAIPNFNKACQTTARNQTLVNEAQIACALERYHLAHSEYPETLNAMAPQFIERVPHDVIDGQPLHYHRTENGKFLLYSVGWNETDDGGVTVKDKSGNEERNQGDWVWKFSE